MNPNIYALVRLSRSSSHVVVALALVACSRSTSVPLGASPSPPILLFKGTGTSPNDVSAVEAVLAKNRLSYSTADSAELSHPHSTNIGKTAPSSAGGVR